MPALQIETLDDVPGFERVQSFRGGVNGFDNPVELPADTSQLFENMLVPDSLVCQTRPGADAVTGGSAPSGGKIQGLQYFETYTYGKALIAAANAALAYYNGTTWTAMGGFTLTSASALFASAQLINKVYITDGVQNWRSWDGAAFVDLGNTVGVLGSPPVRATIVVTHTNRLFASGDAQNPDTIWVSDILNGAQWDHVKFSFRVGGGNGDPIVALAPMQDSWLLVVCRNSLHLVNTLKEATLASQWEIQHLPSGIGGVGKRAVAVNGNDVLIMASDGVRSVRRMASAVGQYEVTPPLSEPVQSYIARINWAQKAKICAWNYRQFTMFALPLDSDTEPTTTLVYNNRTESWMGIWTGWTPTCFATTWFSDAPRLMIGDSAGKVNQWKDYASEDLTTTFQDNGVDITTLLRSKAFNFQEPVSMKDGYFFEARFKDTSTTVVVTLYLDGEESRNWELNLEDVDNQLPVNLPFDLASTKPKTKTGSLDELEEFNEIYVEISATSGKVTVKNFTLAAFVNTIRNEAP
jgi:hypothetical protein